MMREQKGIFIPEQDKSKFWSKNFEIREYNKIKPKGYTALDIGAHVGIWTRRLAVDFQEVIAFEPLPKHIECHKKNCEEYSNVVLHKIALSNTNEKKVMTTKDIIKLVLILLIIQLSLGEQPGSFMTIHFQS